jgi:hypothetical protein
MSRRTARIAPLVLVVVAATTTTAWGAGIPDAPPGISGGGAASGGVEAPGGVVVEFEIGIDGDRFGTAPAAYDLSVHIRTDAGGCDYAASTAPGGGATAVDTGADLHVTVADIAGDGGCADLARAELGIAYADASLVVTLSPAGHGCRRLLRENAAGTARARVTAGEVDVDEVGIDGSGAYAREELLCPTA